MPPERLAAGTCWPLDEKEPPGKLTLAALPKGNPRIVRRPEEYFEANNIASDKFSQYLPADHFFANKATLLAKLDDATLERAERLFARINAPLS